MANRLDDFNRNVSPLGTPSDGGSAWIAYAGVFSTLGATQAQCASGVANGATVLECSNANGSIQFTVKGTGGYTNKQSMVVRGTDASNFNYCMIGSAGLQLAKRVAGVNTNFGSAYATAIIATDVLKITVDASNTYNVYKNGALVIGPVTEVANATGTQHGLGATATSIVFDDFSFTDPISVPNAPTIGIAIAGNAQASIAFTAPVSDGGSAITGYTAISTPSGITASGASSPLTVTGLTNGTAYTFTVHATNAIGNSTESASSNSVTPISKIPVITNNLMRRSS
jgi:hypothetical protein